MSKATNIRAELIPPQDDVHRFVQAKPGAFHYVSNDRPDVGIILSCPCGCGQLGYLNLDEGADGPCWTNSGTREAPTLSPSVGIKKYRDGQDVEADGFHWHGWLRAGVWESC